MKYHTVPRSYQRALQARDRDQRHARSGQPHKGCRCKPCQAMRQRQRGELTCQLHRFIPLCKNGVCHGCTPHCVHT